MLILKHKTRYAAIGGGIGAGMALNKCAQEFNRIQKREARVNNVLNGGNDDFEHRVAGIKQKYREIDLL